MELRIKHHPKNKWPLQALLIRGQSMDFWLKELSAMGIVLSDVEAYALTDESGQSVSACLILTNVKVVDIGRNEYLQVVEDLLVIPQSADLYPELLETELRQLLGNSKYLLYPGIGLVSLSEKIDWTEHIQPPLMVSHRIQTPVPGTLIPSRIKSFQIFSTAPQETLDRLESGFPKREGEDRAPLNLMEKLRLHTYRLMFNNGMVADHQSSSQTASTLISKIRKDFENLEFRNQNHVDRLLNILKSDPAQGLKYAIPLDEAGSTRGETSSGGIGWSMHWLDFSLDRSVRHSGSGSVSIGDRFYELQAQYHKTAQALIKQKEFEKAAFVYLKLLKDYTKAAETLEDAGLYSEAAAVYLKYGSDKKKAAMCYERGKMYLEAIEIYKDFEQQEKVGDLCLIINKLQDAMHYFQKAVDIYKDKYQFLKASFICKNKMQNIAAAQALLLEGWRNDRDAFNCLQNYFNNISDLSLLREEINGIYQNEVEYRDQELFLNVIHHEFNKRNELSGFIRDLAYEIIAGRILKHPEIVSELTKFNEKDKELVKDIIRFNPR